MHIILINIIHFSPSKYENILSLYFYLYIFYLIQLKYNNVEEKLKKIKFNFLIKLKD